MGQFILNGRNYSGLTYANGCFIDTDNIIASGSYSGSFSYTATEDCFFYGQIANNSNNSASIQIDGNEVFMIYDSSVNQSGTAFALKKGQTISLTTTFSGASVSYKVFGIQQGSPVTFLSEYASACYDTTEREVGCWVDGKPIYQITRAYNNTGGQTVRVSVADLNIDRVVETKLSSKNTPSNQVGSGYYINSGDYLRVYLDTSTNELVFDRGTYHAITSDGFVTILYTKTTDVAGSGKLTPTAMPTVHYDSNEKIIGTWFGETLYEKVISLTSGITIGSYGHISLPANSIVRGLDGYAYRNSHASVDRFNGFINSGDLYASIRSGQIEYWISNIFSPVEEITFTIQYTKTT